MSGPVPESEKLRVQSHPPWADGQMAAMLDALVDVPLVSQTITPSQSWRWPRPVEGESLGKYLLGMNCVRNRNGWLGVVGEGSMLP